VILINPDCNDGKHWNCTGGYDTELDEECPCPCTCHVG
jgi:hypothetical protein